jgi:hypothetical protein
MMKKMVNGVERDCTPEEEAAILAEWAAEAAKVAVPQFVSARQAWAELIDRELLEGVEAILNAMEGKAGALARNDFHRAQEWRRDWPLIAQLQPVLGWSDAFVDELFIGAGAR